MIRPELSSPDRFRNTKFKKNLKKSIFFLFFKDFLAEKKNLSSYFSNIRRTQYDQSSPVQPVSESRGGSTSVTEKDKGYPCV